MSLLNDALRKNTNEARIKKTGYFDRSHASPPKEKGRQVYRICGLLLLLGGVVFGVWHFLGSFSAQVDSPVVANRISKPIEIETTSSISKTTGTYQQEAVAVSAMPTPKGEFTLLAEPDKRESIKKTDPPAKRSPEKVSPPPAKKAEKKLRLVKKESPRTTPKEEVELKSDMPTPIGVAASLEESVELDASKKTDLSAKRRPVSVSPSPTRKAETKPHFVKKESPRKTPKAKSTSLPSHQEALFLKKAYRYHRQGKINQAIQMYQQVLRVKPDHRDALFNLASAYIQLTAYSEALPLLRKLRSYDDGNPDVLVNLAIVEIGMGNSTEAIHLLDLAAKQYADPKFEIYFHRAAALSRIGRLEEALHSYKSAEELNPKHPTLSFNLALLCDKLQKYHDAVDYYAEFLSQGGNLSRHEEKRIESRIRSLQAYLAGNGSY
jgi:tetratricopeptide (TPR) repeat protein